MHEPTEPAVSRDLIANPTGETGSLQAGAAHGRWRCPTIPEAEFQPPPKKSDPLPRPGDAYRAHARFLNRLSTDPKLIHFVAKDCWLRGVLPIPTCGGSAGARAASRAAARCWSCGSSRR